MAFSVLSICFNWNAGSRKRKAWKTPCISSGSITAAALMYLTKIATSLIGGAVLLEDTGSSDIFLPVCSCNFGMQEDGFEWKVLRASEKLERNNLFCTYVLCGFVCTGII